MNDGNGMTDSSSATEWLSGRDVAERSGMSESFISKAATQRKLPSFKVGRLRKYSWDEIEAWRAGEKCEEIEARRSRKGTKK
jgi:predicted DNA-binding transcriptional regulator AlpA